MSQHICRFKDDENYKEDHKCDLCNNVFTGQYYENEMDICDICHYAINEKQGDAVVCDICMKEILRRSLH